jgi:hypothetical protein
VGGELQFARIGETFSFGESMREFGDGTVESVVEVVFGVVPHQ